jgi:hypothetical protein
MYKRKYDPNPTFHKRRVAGVFDKVLFFLCFILGAGGIVGLKYLGMSQLIVTVFPVAVMLFYFLYIIIFKRFKLREDVAGDNLYYLGFLFTLTSLSFALYLFAMREGGTESLISNFGIALGTTIVGLTFRVIFNQMRQDPLEIENEARLELGEATSRLKAELNNVVLDLNSFRRATQQSILEGIEEIGKQSSDEIQKVARNINSVVETTFGDATKALDTMSGNAAKALDSMSGNAAKALDSMSGNAVKLVSVTNGTIDSIKDLNTRIESIEINRDIVTEKLEPAFDSLIASTGELQNLAREDQKQVRRLTKLVDKAITSAETLDTHSYSFSDNMNSLDGVIKDVVLSGDGLKTLCFEVVKSFDTFKNIGETQEKYFRKLIEENENIQSSFRILHQNEDFIQLKIKENSEEQFQIMDSLSERIKDRLEIIKHHNDELEKEFGRSRLLTKKIEGSLSSMAEVLVENLRRPIDEIPPARINL